MKIRNKGRHNTHDVYAIAVYTSEDFGLRTRAVFYAFEDGMLGLSAESFDEIDIVDSNLGADFKIHPMAHNKGFMILWDYFDDIDHLARLINLESDTLETFEKARSDRKLR